MGIFDWNKADAGVVDQGEPGPADVVKNRNQFASSTPDRMMSLNDFSKVYNTSGGILEKYTVQVDPQRIRALSRDSGGNPDGGDVSLGNISKTFGLDTPVEIEVALNVSGKQWEVHNAALFAAGLIAADATGNGNAFIAASFLRNG